jgi:hypothetical protein
MTARQLGQSHAVGLNEPHARFLRSLNELAHARIAARRFKINFNNRMGRCFQTHTQGVKTEKDLRRGHAPIILGI